MSKSWAGEIMGLVLTGVQQAAQFVSGLERKSWEAGG